jgi:hypothetical protein
MLELLINNPLTQVVAGAVIGGLGGKLFGLFWDSMKVSGIIRGGAEKLGNSQGLWAKKQLDRIKDEEIRTRLLAELKEAPDAYDKGWDAGLDGIQL